VGRRWITTKAFAFAVVGLCILGNIGTQSRGGTLGLVAAVLYGWMFVMRRKVVGVVIVVVFAIGVVAVAPNGYLSRMGTVAKYEEDNSAQQRLQAWGAALRMARDHPLGVGAGNFNSAYGRRYNPSTVGQGEARVGWGAARWISPHSIYFKVLGEYGFLGCALLIWLIVANLIDNFRSGKLLTAAGDRAAFDPRWAGLLNMSILGFAISGIFLGGFRYPHLFLLSGLTVALKRAAAVPVASEAVAVPAQRPSMTRPNIRAAMAKAKLETVPMTRRPPPGRHR
jgi:putative inorganic carbon (hco3(-)) transporter